MIKLGVNSVLFSGFDFATAVKQIKMAGYDGVEISAIKGMCEHLTLGRKGSHVSELKQTVADNGLEFLSMEVATLDEERLMLAFDAGGEMGIPIINIASGGKSNEDEDFDRQTDLLARMAEKAEQFGVTLCCKAHVGGAIYNTASTLRAARKIKSPAFGVDLDPSHLYRASEDPSTAIESVLPWVRHIHIRDCKGRGPSPGTAPMQACGRGDIDLTKYCKVMVDGSYAGPVCLEVIGAHDLDLVQCAIIAAESYGYLNAILKQLGAR